VKRYLAAPLAVALVCTLAQSPAHGKTAPAPKASTAPAAGASSSAAPAPSPTASAEPLDRAVPRLEAKIKSDPNDKASMQELAGDYLQLNRPDLALALTQKLITGGTKTAQIYFFDGFANGALGRQQQALADFESASNLEPTNAQVLSQLTNLYLRLNRPADAERIAKRAITFNKDDKSVYLTYGRVFAAEQKYEDARTQFEQAAKLDPKDPAPPTIEAQTYIDQNSVALASQLFDRALAIDPKYPEALLGRARVAAAGHDVKTAVSYFDRLLAIQTDPTDKAAVVDAEAQVYAGEKMTGEADATYKRAIADYPSAPGAHIAYGDYLASIKDSSRAEAEWTAALGPNRDNGDALFRLGELYGQQKQYAKATDSFKRYSTVQPNDPRGYFVLGQLYTLQNQNGPAHAAFAKAYEISRTPEALVALGQNDYASHNYPECAKIFEAFDRAAPQLIKQNPPLLFVMGQCYANTKQKDKARSAYQRYLALLPPGSAAATRVKKYLADLGSSRPAPSPTRSPAKK